MCLVDGTIQIFAQPVLAGLLSGLTLEAFGQLFADLGCKAAYNLDGGDSSAMYFNGQVYGPNGRGTSDIIYIAEPDTQA